MEKTEEYYNNLDKRTKEYKEWKESQLDNLTPMSQEELEAKHEEVNSSGVGDLVEKVTKATGIKKAVEFLAGEDCGCDDRKKKLNKLRFRKTPKCLLEEEYNFLDKLYNNGRATIGQTEGIKLLRIEERIFSKKYTDIPNCPDCIRQIYRDLKEVYNTYK